MKKQIITAAAIVAFAMNTQNTHAQGLLGRLKDKVSQTTDMGGGAKAGEIYLPSGKQAKKDLETTNLETADFSIDKTGMSGVYISQKDIALTGERGVRFIPQRSIKKLAIQFSATGKSLTITSNLTKDGIKPLLLRTPYGGKDHAEIEALMLKNKMYFNYSKEDTDFDSRAKDLYYVDSLYQFERMEPWAFDFSQNFTVLEPGVIVMHPTISLKDTKKCTGAKVGYQNDETMKNLPFNLLYKSGQNISKWNKQAISSKLFELAAIYCKGNIGVMNASTTMPKKVTGFAGEPSNATLLAAAKTRAKEYRYTETVVSVYPTSGWSDVIKPLGYNQLPTLVGRTHAINVNMKDDSGCYIEVMYVTQDNIYTVGSMAANYTGKAVYASSNGSPENIDCAKIK